MKNYIVDLKIPPKSVMKEVVSTWGDKNTIYSELTITK